MAYGRQSPYHISLSPTERAELERWQRATTIQAGLAKRAKIIRLHAEGHALMAIARRLEVGRRIVRKRGTRFLKHRIAGLSDKAGRGRQPVFSPEVAVHLVKLACERPDMLGRSLSQWECLALARQLQREGIVQHLSAETVRRILEHHKLKPWRHHAWLSPTTPRDLALYAAVSEIIDLSTRPLRNHEVVLCVDEKTSLQPRPRLHATRPARPGRPHQVAHESQRDGALNLFAAFNPRTGRVFGQGYARKRQGEFIAFVAHLDAEISTKIKTIHIVCDNARPHHGKQVREWLTSHPRFVLHFTPVHCSCLNQVEQWFSILQRKRLRVVDFASKADLQATLMHFMAEWNEMAHPFNWTTKSVTKVMADAVPVAA
jgi:transposase